MSSSRQNVLQVHPNYEAMSRAAAELILREVTADPRLLLGAATGSTPARTYDLLAQAAAHDPDLFREIRLLKLDEWGGLAMDDPATCEVYLRRHLINPLRITPEHYLGWNSRPADPQAECQRVATWLREHGPIDLCVLGLGANGHLAFNEPADQLIPGSHVTRLTQTSLSHPMLESSRERPTFGLTAGMADILQSRRILLLVSGVHKARQLRQLMDGGISTQFPASFLLLHRNLTILCDHDAAANIDRANDP